ncbi:MAG: hypothetical protein H5T74_13545 [Actinobacteria bacterium]|nr:hypothetical protein [Actinomycetota bacterium]
MGDSRCGKEGVTAMFRKLLLLLTLATLAAALFPAAGCGKNGGGTAPGGGDVQEGKAQVLLFTTPT